MKKLKNYTKSDYKKALLRAYKEMLGHYSLLRLQKKCIDEDVCPNCLERTRVYDGSAFRCSECDFKLSDIQYNKLFEKLN